MKLMKKWVKDLLDLQTSDIRIKKMKYRLLEIPREKKQITLELETEKKKSENSSQAIKKTELEIKKVESKILGFKDKIKGYQDKSALVKKNDEYRALMTEIETCKYHIEELEGKEITIMDELESNKKALANAEKAFKNIERDVEESREELEELAESLEAEIEKGMKARKAKLAKVDSSLLPLYSRLIKKDGEPITAIRNGTCGFCHLKLTPQTLNDSKKGMVAACDFCGHLVYSPED
jgi:uncharacterized protein